MMKNKTHQFKFDLDAISLADLKTLYKHFQIEDFGNPEKAIDRASFFNCFIDEDTDGNKDAYLLIRLAALMASNSAKLVDNHYVNSRGKDKIMTTLGINILHEVEFDAADYDHFITEDGGICIEQTILDYSVEAMIPLLSKYHFLETIQSNSFQTI
jgi:hypothetical protein